MKTHTVSFLIVMGLIALDQWTKWLAQATLQGREAIELIPSFLYLRYHINPGAAWGLLEGQFYFFVLITFAALAVFTYWAKDNAFKTKPFYSLALVLLISGTIGNFIDRVRFRYVIDFIDVYIFTYDFPIFNVADMALTIGVALFAIDLVFFDKRRVTDGA